MLDAQTADRAPVPALEVRGETRCPRRDEVAEALSHMLGPASPDAQSDVAELREEGDSFIVTLRRSGELVGEKRMPASLACAVRAEVAAVSIAAFEARLGGADSPPPVPSLDATPAPPPVASVAAAPAAAATPDTPASFEVGAAAVASLNGTDAAPAARVEAVVRRGESSWSINLAALIVGAHRIDVSPGEGRWWRAGGELAVGREVRPGGDVRLQARAGLALAAIAVQGRGYSHDLGDTLLDPGAVAGVRVVPFAWRVRPWLDVAAAYWPRSHVLSVSTGPGGGAVAGRVPRGEVFVGLGASFGGPR